MNTPATCPRCGAPLTPGAQTCANCGFAVAAPGPAGPPQSAQYTPPPPGGYGAPTGAPPPYGSVPPPGYGAPPPGYSSAPPAYGPPPAAPRGRPRWLFWVLGAVVVLILACAAFFFVILSVVNGALGPVTTAGDSFMGALRDGNYAQAFTACTPALQSKLSDAQGLQTLIEQNGKQPKTWTFNSRNQSGNQATFSGTATYANGSSGNINLTLNQAGSTWQVDSFDFK